MSSLRRPLAAIVLLPLLVGVLAGGWAEIRESWAVLPRAELVVFLALIVATGIGIAWSTRRSGRSPVVVAILIALGMALAAFAGSFAILYVAARHGDLG